MDELIAIKHRAWERQRPMPRELQAPISVARGAIPNGMAFTFATTVDPPPKGVRIAVTTTLHSTAPDEVGVITTDSDGTKPLAALLDKLAHTLSDFTKAAKDVRVRVQPDRRIGQPIPFFGTTIGIIYTKVLGA